MKRFSHFNLVFSSNLLFILRKTKLFSVDEEYNITSLQQGLMYLVDLGDKMKCVGMILLSIPSDFIQSQNRKHLTNLILLFAIRLLINFSFILCQFSHKISFLHLNFPFEFAFYVCRGR